MNPLDDLLASTGRVPDISPDGLRTARAVLDTAINGATMQQNTSATELDRKRASRWLSGWRGRTLVGVTAVAAAAAAVIAVSVVPASRTGTPAAGSASQPTVKASAKATAKPKPTIHVGFGPATTNATAAQLLDEAATAAGSQQGWPNAGYWYTESKGTNLLNGKVTYYSTWNARNGNGVTAQSTTPLPEGATNLPGPSSNPDVPFHPKGGVEAWHVISNGVPAFYGYSWSQLYTLPTNDTAVLEANLMTTGDIHFGPKAPGVKDSWTGQEDLFQMIMGMLSSTPATPALQEALYKVAATIPGVTVKGTYTDALGRTGTALQLGIMTMVVDTRTGQLLDQMWGALPDAVNCSKVTGWCQVTDPVTGKIEQGVRESGPTSTMLITQGPATGLPKIVG
jgi:hypothetical protein